MASDHIRVLTDQKRIGEAEGSNTARYLRDLHCGMSTCITSRRDQSLYWPIFDAQLIAGYVFPFRDYLGHADPSLKAAISTLPPPPEFRDNFPRCSFGRPENKSTKAEARGGGGPCLADTISRARRLNF